MVSMAVGLLLSDVILPNFLLLLLLLLLVPLSEVASIIDILLMLLLGIGSEKKINLSSGSISYDNY